MMKVRVRATALYNPESINIASRQVFAEFCSALKKQFYSEASCGFLH